MMPETSRSHAVGPADRPGVQPPEPGHLVITVHGIRTYGNWQRDLESLLKMAEPTIRVRNYQYGYFSSIAFLIPPLRWLVARRFHRFFAHAISEMPPGSRIDLVAHSFGTYLAASALAFIPKGYSVNTVIFAGSVLTSSFPWYRYQQADRVGHVVNECGFEDSILVLCQLTALLLGMAGRVGFQGMVGDRFVNRYYKFGHGGYFERPDFMRLYWVPLLTSDAEALRIDERPRLTPLTGARLFLLNNFQFVKIAGAAALALAVVIIPLDWMRKAEFKKRVDRFVHIARLANAEHIPGRDPDHIRDLLKVDTPDGDRVIDHIVGADANAGGDDLAETGPGDDDAPSWYEAIPGLGDLTRLSYHARRQHARANYQLAIGKGSKARDLSKARVLFEDAINSYKQVNQRDPAHGSYALCLIDYGRLLYELGLYDKAIVVYQQVRNDVFPKDADGKSPTMPRSLVVDSYCNEAEALKGLERWDDAANRLTQAIAEAEKDNALLSLVYNTFAWRNMDRLEVSKARENFRKARDACQALVAQGYFVYKTRLYHIRHGLAMTERLLGDADESYNQYDQLVAELQDVMQRDLTFTPKERSDLRDRLVNSMERRADVRFFARKSPTFFEKVKSDQYRRVFDKVEADYQEAIRKSANDDLTIKARLLYKKVIAHCLGALQGEAAPGGAGAVGPIDIQFAEAQMTYDSLPPELRSSLDLYRQLAGCAMVLHRTPTGPSRPRAEGFEGTRQGLFTPQAVTDLRNLTVDYAARCESLGRENVEMLLVALEMLLEVGMQDGDAKRVEDASRMTAVLGATTKARLQDELRDYVARFNLIAARALDEPGRGGAGEKTIAHMVGKPVPGDPRPAEGRLLFFLRISPTRSLRLTEDVFDPAQRRAGEPGPERDAAGAASLSAK